jgi:hypothetical protein
MFVGKCLTTSTTAPALRISYLYKMDAISWAQWLKPVIPDTQEVIWRITVQDQLGLNVPRTHINQ